MKKSIVAKVIEDAANSLGIRDLPPVEIEIPRNEQFGDLSATTAMTLAAVLRKPPRKIAEELVSAIRDIALFEKIEVAGPGFINFTFSKDYLVSEVMQLLRRGKKFLREDLGKGKKIQIEFVSANPTGPLHLGHGRGGATGEALANLLTAAGYRVEREYYVNDAGRQVRLLGLSVFARYQQLLGAEYPFPEEGYKGAYIEDIAREIIGEHGKAYLQTGFDSAADVFTEYAYRKILRSIQEDLKAFGISFDTWQSERELFAEGAVQNSIEELNGKGFLYEQDGAVWFRATAFGDEKDRVIIKQDGEYTYFTSDIAYHRRKLERGFDELIDIWGADHHGYIPRIHAVVEALGHSHEKLKVLLVQMVNLLRGGKPVQMSKRAGEFVTLREVIDEVGPDITKFIFLTRRPDSQLEFDLETARAKSAENPVFYVQYAHARINSVFIHARDQGISVENLQEARLELLSQPEELRIMKKLLLYPVVFEGAVLAHEPHRITFYIQELAGIFHPYYTRHRIVTEDLVLSAARLALCDAVRIVLHEGLEILGVKAPDKM
ncbi:MAG: arginine--tRNA ligase [Nitrospirota bacterium]